MNNHSIEISWGSLWRIFAMIAFAVFLYLVKDVLVILFLAIVVSAALDGPVDYLEKKKLPRVLGTFILFILAIAVFSLILYTIIPASLLEFKHLLINVSKIDLPVLGSLNLNISDAVNNFSQNLGNWADLLFSGSASLVNVVMSVSGNLITIIIVFVLAFYLTVDREGVEKFLRLALPVTREDYAVNIYKRVRKKMSLWLKGQLLLMFIMGVLASLGLWILGVNYSLILGILTGLLEIVPIAGAIFSGVIAFLIAISDSAVTGLYAIGLFVVLHQLENHLLVPVVMKKAMGISPVVVVIAILMGSKLAGLAGVVLAVPIVMIAQELLLDWERYKFREKSHRTKLI